MLSGSRSSACQCVPQPLAASREGPEPGPVYPPESMGEPTAAQQDPADRFADDPAFALHEGGKLGSAPRRSVTRPTCRWPTRRGWPGSPARSPRTRSWPPATPGPPAGRGGHRRHRGARPRRHRAGRVAAGDGGQVLPVPGVRRAGRGADRAGHHRRRRDRRDGGRRGAVLRRHQPGGHQRPALLRDRGAAAGAAGHPGLPRRPARHRDRRPGRAAQRRPADRPGARGPAGGRLRRRSRRRRLHEDPARRRGRRHRGGRLPGHPAPRPART